MSGTDFTGSSPEPEPADGPSRVLDDDPRFSVEHRLRRAASSPAHGESAPEAPGYRKQLIRDLVILVFVALLGLAIAPFADVANEDYPEARAIADRIQATWRSIVSEGADPDEAAASAGLRVFVFEAAGSPRTILTHPEPTAAGSCYAIRFGPGIVTDAGILLDTAPGCTPLPPGTFEHRGSWSEVLPSERTTPVWFVPLVVLLSGAGLIAVTGIPLALLAKLRSQASPTTQR